MVKCVVSGCPNRVASGDAKPGLFNRPQKRFFSFPKDPARVKVWLAALRETEKQDSSDQHLICEDHFLPEDINTNGVNSDAIPIMPPCLDGSMGISSWGAGLPEEEEDEEEEDQWGDAGVEEGEEEEEEEDVDEECEGGNDAPVKIEPPEPEPPAAVDPPRQDFVAKKTQETSTAGLNQTTETQQTKMFNRQDVSLGVLTQGFLKLLLSSPDGTLDLRNVTVSLQTRKRRVYDITNVLEGISLIEKQSANTIRWTGRCQVSRFLWKNQHLLQKELENMKLVEDTLDTLIKSCAQQLFEMTDDPDNAQLAYLTKDDVNRIKCFQEQTLIVIKAPEETKLEVPAPKEDSIQAHLKGVRGPILAVTCDVGTGDSGSEKSGRFLTLEESRIKTSTLHTTETAGQHGAVQSA